VASTIVLAFRVADQQARRAMAALEDRARRMGRSVERTAHRMADAGENAWRRIRAGANAAFTAAVNIASRVLTQLTETLMEGARAAATMSVKMAGLGAVLVPMVGTVGNLLGALILIPGAIVTIGTFVNVLKLATSGVQDLISTGLSGDAKEFEKELKKFDYNTASFARTVVRLAGAWKEVRNQVRFELFSSADRRFQQLTDHFLPTILRRLPQVARAFNHAGQALVDWLISSDAVQIVDRALNNIAGTASNVGRVLRPVAQILLDLVDVGTGEIFDLSRGLGEAAENAAAWIREMKETGKLHEWLNTALATLKQMHNIGMNVFEIFRAIWRAGREDSDSFLDALERGTQAMADFLDSRRGQELLGTLGDVSKVLVWMGEQAGTLMLIWSSWYQGMKVLWATLAKIALESLYKILSGATVAFGWMPGIGDKLKQATAAFKSFAESVIADLNRIPNRQVYIDVIQRGTPGVSGSNERFNLISGRRHAGGPAHGWNIVNERGPEAFKLPQGTMVVPNGSLNSATRGLSGSAGAGSGELRVSVQPGAGAGLAGELLRMLRFEIRRGYGGNVQSALGSP
jgi:hypothetical protein